MYKCENMQNANKHILVLLNLRVLLYNKVRSGMLGGAVLNQFPHEMYVGSCHLIQMKKNIWVILFTMKSIHFNQCFHLFWVCQNLCNMYGNCDLECKTNK